jgi:hypothetical protein
MLALQDKPPMVRVECPVFEAIVQSERNVKSCDASNLSGALCDSTSYTCCTDQQLCYTCCADQQQVANSKVRP